MGNVLTTFSPQYVLESPDRTHHITEFSTDPITARILQIEVQAERKEILILTENLVSEWEWKYLVSKKSNLSIIDAMVLSYLSSYNVLTVPLSVRYSVSPSPSAPAT